MGAFKNAAGKPVLMRMVKGIQDNKAYLGEVDGLIGDGDHGMNMNKGMQQPGSLWKCQCGAENTGRFCEYCGQPRPF